MIPGNRNIIITVVLTCMILLGSEYLLRPKQAPVLEAPQAVSNAPLQTPQVQPDQRVVGRPISPSLPVGSAPKLPRERLLQQGERLKIQTASLEGSLRLQGAMFDDLLLKKYREQLDPSSPQIVLLSPEHSENPYQAFMGWYSPDTKLRLPDAQTLWKADQHILTPQQPVRLTWENGQGVTFEQMVAVDDNYLFTVTQRVLNQSGSPISLGTQGLALRTGTPQTSGFFISYEGPLGVFNGTLKEVAYKDLVEKPLIEQATSQTWIGITDKFWLVSLVPEQTKKVDSAFQYYEKQAGMPEAYQVFFREKLETLAPQGVLEAKNYVFAGAKELNILDDYENRYQIRHFDLAVDFGWFYFLTKPIFYALAWLKDWTGNFGFAILVFTVLLKLLFFPLANKSYQSMARMKKLKPQLDALNKRYASDKTRLHQEIWALYKKEKVNPVSGCLPMLVQIPVFFALYKVLFVSIEMRHAPFFGWIQDLSAPDPTTLFNLFGLLPWTPPSFLMIGGWPLIMAATMFFQQKLNPPQADPIQEKMFLYVMPVVFTVMLAQFPAGLVIYWAWHNALTILQQWIVMYYYEKKTA
ncbi:MAG: membrane protein insertase YidC [Alphaproteobacteria bacterium]